MKILIVGAGGIGGYFGGKLVKAGFDVTFLLREKTFKIIKEKGLQIKSIHGDFNVTPKVTNDVKSINEPDLIILAVKSWQVVDVAHQIKPILIPKTMVLPLQNGADNAEKLRTVLNTENVLAGLCKIVSKVESPGIINHFAFEPEIIFGEYSNQQTTRIQNVKRVFDASEFKNKIPTNIHLNIWRKFLFITMVSGIGAVTRSDFGTMKQHTEIREMILNTGKEIVEVANAKGIQLTNDDIEKAMYFFDSSSPNATASMQRDLMEGKPSELENFNGYVVEQGLELAIKTPVNSFIYHSLLPQEQAARKNA